MKRVFNHENVPYLPDELVDIIVDYVDYEKYCKPQHYDLLQGVINDIGDMASIMTDIKPSISIKCWGITDQDNLHYQSDEELDLDDDDWWE